MIRYWALICVGFQMFYSVSCPTGIGDTEITEDSCSSYSGPEEPVHAKDITWDSEPLLAIDPKEGGPSGVRDDPTLAEPHLKKAAIDLNDPFDARTYPPWARCPSILYVWQQGNCGACYAVAASSVLTDGACIAGYGNEKIIVWASAKQAASTTFKNRSPAINCAAGGRAEQVFQMVSREGINTGGPRKDKGGCAPWAIPPFTFCWKIKVKANPPIHPATACANKIPMARDKFSIYSLWSRYTEPYKTTGWDQVVNEMKMIILTRGPIAVSMSVFEDFEVFNFGKFEDKVKVAYIKSPTAKETIFPQHDMKIVGWEKCKDSHAADANLIDCWIFSNIWGDKWGVRGFGYIRMGTNEVGIESIISAPIFHHPDAPTENACRTVDFCARPLDQIISTNVQDLDAPFYAIHGGCAQRLFASEDGRLSNVGPSSLGLNEKIKAVPIQWVIPETAVGAINRYALAKELAPSTAVGIWLFTNTGRDGIHCTSLTDDQLRCTRNLKPNEVAPVIDPASATARAMYYENNVLKSLSYDLRAPTVITTETNGVIIPVGTTISDKFSSVTALAYVGNRRLFVSGVDKSKEPRPITAVYTYEANRSGFKELITPESKKALVCVE